MYVNSEYTAEGWNHSFLNYIGGFLVCKWTVLHFYNIVSDGVSLKYKLEGSSLPLLTYPYYASLFPEAACKAFPTSQNKLLSFPL